MNTAELFEAFHYENPNVYHVLVRLARKWVAARGRTRLGIRMIWEVARWELIMSTGTADYKLNDHYTGYYARLIMAENPDLRGIFDIRDSEADQWLAQRLGRTA